MGEGILLFWNLFSVEETLILQKALQNKQMNWGYAVLINLQPLLSGG
jgi:hypothetical protein